MSHTTDRVIDRLNAEKKPKMNKKEQKISELMTRAMQSEMIDKIGIDLDLYELRGNKALKLLTTFFNARGLFPSSDIIIYKSSSELGYHLEIVGEEIKKLTPDEKIAIRDYLGDCQGRLRFSIMRGGDDILFESKSQGHVIKDRRLISSETILYPYERMREA